MIRLGRDLTVATYAHIGPRVADRSKRYAGNDLSCQSCHLEAGTKRYGLPFVGVFADFPQYRSREGEVGTLEDRVNGCMTRSMNGRTLPDDSTEMRAFVAYIKFLSTGGKQDGRGSAKLPELDRAADPVHGKAIYAQICVACHGIDGQGKRRPGAVDGYEFPPLWGRDSFNDGAGMARLIAAANFIHSNMPNGTTWQAPGAVGRGFVGRRRLCHQPRAPAQSRPGPGFPQAAGKAGRCLIRPVRRRLSGRAAQVRPVRPDPREDQGELGAGPSFAALADLGGLQPLAAGNASTVPRTTT